MSERHKHILILGGDISGPMAAAYLRSQLPDIFDITFINSGQIERPEWFASTHSDIRHFHRVMRMPELRFVKNAAASFKLGERYEGWGNNPYILPYAEYGLPINGVSFFKYYQRIQAESNIQKLSQYCFPVSFGQAGKFQPPDPKGRPIVADFDYGYHLDVMRYAALLITYAKELGLRVIKERPAKIDHEGGKITQITLDNGQALSADLFIDCSGTARLLTKSKYENWVKWGFTQSHETSSGQETTLSAFTNFEAKSNHWHMSAEHQHGSNQLRLSFDRDLNTSHNIGCAIKPWSENVLVLGLAAAELEPTLSMPLRAIQLDLERFVRLLPTDFKNPIECVEYNRLANSSYERMRDYQLLQYKTQQIWKRFSKVNMPDTVDYKYRLYASRGRIATLDDDGLFFDQWAPMLWGNGVIPNRVDPIAAHLDQDQIMQTLENLNRVINQATSAMPSQADFIRRNCAAEGFKG